MPSPHSKRETPSHSERGSEGSAAWLKPSCTLPGCIVYLSPTSVSSGAAFGLRLGGSLPGGGLLGGEFLLSIGQFPL
jgi:hypothetical protein